MAADRQRSWVAVSVIATVFNPLLNLFFIPYTQRVFDNGAIGAATVTVLTELILMIGAIVLRPAGVLDRATMNVLLRVVIASGAMIPPVLLINQAPLVAQITVGIAVYVAASIALRTFSPRDVLSWVKSARNGRRSSGGGLEPPNLPVQVSAREP
jgi:O-antigen/teichoic acid export membrane protein